MAGVKSNPTQAAQNWHDRFASAGDAYTTGINAVTVSPGQAAAAKADFWASQVAMAKTRFATNSAAVTISDWKTAATTTGVARLASGATKGQSKLQNVFSKLLPAINQAVQNAGPSGTFEQNMARFAKYATALHNARGSFTA